ncbi:hypothetical protein NL676_009790 [Syzygium grande]|nr:hypothetical protein NL676_009790 [Syzygium grande]
MKRTPPRISQHETAQLDRANKAVRNRLSSRTTTKTATNAEAFKRTSGSETEQKANGFEPEMGSKRIRRESKPKKERPKRPKRNHAMISTDNFQRIELEPYLLRSLRTEAVRWFRRREAGSTDRSFYIAS